MNYLNKLNFINSKNWQLRWEAEYEDVKETITWPEQKETGYIRIKRTDIQNFMTQDLYSAISTYNRIKQYGWPQGKGYLDEPVLVFEIVELFDAEKIARKNFDK